MKLTLAMVIGLLVAGTLAAEPIAHDSGFQSLSGDETIPMISSNAWQNNWVSDALSAECDHPVSVVTSDFIAEFLLVEQRDLVDDHLPEQEIAAQETILLGLTSNPLEPVRLKLALR